MQQKAGRGEPPGGVAWLPAATVRDAVEAIADGFAVYDAADHLVLCNSAFAAPYGLTPAEATGLSFSDLLRRGIACGLYTDFGPDGAEAWIAERAARHRTTSANRTEMAFGPDRHFLVAELRTTEGALVVSRTDITPVKQALAAARANEQQTRLVLDAVPVRIAMIDTSGRLVYANAVFGAAFGQAPEGLAGRTVAEVIGAEAALAMRPHSERALAGETVHWEGWVPFAGQGPRYIARIYAPWRDRTGAIGGYFVFGIDQTEQKTAETRYELALRGANEGLYDWDLVNNRAYYSARLEEMFGYSAAELGETIGQWFHIIHEPDRERVKGEIALLLRGGKDTHTYEFRIRRADGSLRWIYTSGAVARNAEGRVVRMAGSAADITEAKEAEFRLRESEGRYALAVLGSNEGIYDWNLVTGQVFYSPRLYQMFGRVLDPALQKAGLWFEFVHPDDAARVQATMRAFFRSNEMRVELEYRVVLPDGGVRWLLTNGAAARDDNGRVLRLAGSTGDITERKESAARLLHEALHDGLTDLANRTLFGNRLGEAITTFREGGESYAVLVLDLDRFRHVNDTLGHHVGDELLVLIAGRLRAALPAGCMVARLGGDEFAVLAPGCDRDEAMALAERLQDAVGEPVVLRGQEVFPGASIGVAVGSNDYLRAEEVLADADLALYRAKGGGRGHHVAFESSMRRRSTDRLSLEADLRRALDRNELLLHYQPVVRLADGAVTGFEALLRWQHPARGLIPPRRIIPLAEETGLIVPIGRFVLREAARQASIWAARYKQVPLTMGLNVSARQFIANDLLVDVEVALAASGAGPGLLKLEITESLLMQNPELAEQSLRGLRELGVRLAIDDFGTGYSSLSYLHRFPFDTLKIDRSFVMTMLTRPESMVLVRTIASMAHALSMDIVAEGAETAAEVASLAALGCEHCQGFYFARPMPGPEADALLASGRRFTLPG